MVLLPFVQVHQVFGHELNLYSLYKDVCNKFICRSYSFISPQVFEKKAKITEQCFQESCVDPLYSNYYAKIIFVKLFYIFKNYSNLASNILREAFYNYR